MDTFRDKNVLEQIFKKINSIEKKILIVGGTGFIGYHLAKYCVKKNGLLSVSQKTLQKKLEKLKI